MSELEAWYLSTGGEATMEFVFTPVMDDTPHHPPVSFDCKCNPWSFASIPPDPMGGGLHPPTCPLRTASMAIAGDAFDAEVETWPMVRDGRR